MGRKAIRFGLSSKEVGTAIRYLRHYQADLDRKVILFVEKLANIGILVAENNAGHYGQYISFGKDVNSEKTGAKAIVYAINKQLIVSEWQLADGSIRRAEVSPILMSEFGSGLLANNPNASRFGMGQGTFPGQIHANDPDGWWWMTTDGEWHHSYGVSAEMPMAHACTEIIANVRRIAKEVFG